MTTPPEEKAVLVAKAADLGIHTVAEAYGMDWHAITSWKKYNARDVEFKKSPRRKTPHVIIQSPDGRETTVAEEGKKIEANVERIYIRPDQDKAY